MKTTLIAVILALMTGNNEILDEILDELRIIRWHMLVICGVLGVIFGVLVAK